MQRLDRQQECLVYFHQSAVWEKVLKGFREKYSSYGRFSGKVVLKNLKSQDIEELEGFFGKSFHGQKSVTVSAEKFRQALEASRYKDVTPEYLLVNFFGETSFAIGMADLQMASRALGRTWLSGWVTW